MSLSVKIPTTDDLERFEEDPALDIIRAPILFLYINLDASNRSESSDTVKISQILCSFK
jgi:hypothetical protein